MGIYGRYIYIFRLSENSNERFFHLIISCYFEIPCNIDADIYFCVQYYLDRYMWGIYMDLLDLSIISITQVNYSSIPFSSAISSELINASNSLYK